MVEELNLKGNELLVFAIIHGFSQDNESEFNGSLQYLATWTNSTKQGVLKNLKSLLEKDYIIKNEIQKGSIKYCTYRINTKKFNGGEQSLMAHETKFNGTVKQSLPNNIVNNIESNISISKPITNTPTNITKEKKKSKNITIEQGLEIAEEIFKKEEVTDLDGFMVLAKVWLTYREELKKPYVPIGFKMAVKRLLKLSYNNFDKASEIIEFSIANNYQGLFSAK